MNYSELRDEILLDPASLGYAGKSPSEIVELMVGAEVQQECLVSLRELQAMLMGVVVPPADKPIWWVLKDLSSSNHLAEMVFDLFASRLDSIDVRTEFVKRSIAGLLAYQIINDEVVADITSMSFRSVSRGVALFGRAPNSLDVQVALLPE